MSKVAKNVNLETLQVIYQEFMIKIGKEPRIRYYSSKFDDLYIMVEIEHDGVFDMALIDILNEVVDMRIYDAYNFLITDHFKIDMVDFAKIINDMSSYFDNILAHLAQEDLENEEV